MHVHVLHPAPAAILSRGGSKPEGDSYGDGYGDGYGYGKVKHTEGFRLLACRTGLGLRAGLTPKE